jgi:pseudaminic acid cytidylyltransferase
MANLCIIPARSGSKRIPRKNIKDFLGKPIIDYSILAALDSGLFYLAKVSSILAQKSLITNKKGSIVLADLNVQDIDNEIDWNLTELEYKMFCK